MHGIEKRIVYILRSDADPACHYVGITTNVRDLSCQTIARRATAGINRIALNN
jgi:hypothetical protein